MSVYQLKDLDAFAGRATKFFTRTDFFLAVARRFAYLFRH
jgi:hypothetical protein